MKLEDELGMLMHLSAISSSNNVNVVFSYKASVAEESTFLRQEKHALQDKLSETEKTVQHMTLVLQEVQRAQDKAKEEYAR